MFEAVELGQKISKKEFDQEEPELRTRLLGLQHAIRETRIPVIVIVSGVEGAGKGEVVNRLSKWLDPRTIETSAFMEETSEENPRFWQFWRRLPAYGTFGIMFGSWYTRPIVDFVMGRIDNSEYERQLHRIVRFETMLVRDEALIVKFWFHLSRVDQKKKLQKDKKAGRTSPILKQFSKHYDEFTSASEQALRMTDTGDAPWHLIEAANDRYRDISVGRVLKTALEEKLESSSVTATRNDKKVFASIPDDDITILDHVDTTRTIPKKDYRKQLKDYQNEIYRLVWEARKQKRSTIAMFEGWDASGKGGAIRRLTAGMDARLYKVISVAAPTDEERAHHYLWRFWRHLPRAGYVTVYDRSWYGRVLVERVENFATEDEWRRAYGEINEFEEQLQEHGIILTKFWLHLDPEEQLRRFKEREVTPWKQHKITEEDWRNREKWDDYKAAVNDMVAHTSTEYAPWSLIPANDKLFARIEILKTVHDRLARALEKN